MARAYKRKSTKGCIEPRGKRFRIVYVDDATHATVKESGFLSYKEADERLLDLQLGASRPDSRMRWSDYWKRFVSPTLTGLEAKTEHEYRRQWEHDLEPHIGGTEIGMTDWRVVQATMDALPTESVQRHAFALLRKMCNMALRDGLIRNNPCDRSIRFKRKQRAPKELLDPPEVISLLGSIKGYKYEPAILLMLGCGLRVEECLALDWEDLSVSKIGGTEYVTAAITKAVVMVGSEMVEKDTTKNESSVRMVVVGDPFSARLRELMEGPSGPIVWSGRLDANGGRIRTSPSTVSHNFRSWCTARGFRYVPLGQMRSVYATLACEAADSSLVSLVMGHSDGTTRGRNYQSATMRGMALVADLYGEYLLSCE